MNKEHDSRYVRVRLKRAARPKLQETAEGRYWKSFSATNVYRHTFPINCLHFCPAQPHDVAATTGGRVVIYNADSHSIKRTLTKFKLKAQSGVFRRDGQLVAAGSDDMVKVFRAAGGSTLRTFKGHRDNVEVVRFSYDKLSVFSGSHDFTCRLWSLSAGDQVNVFKGHTDYIRAIATRQQQSTGPSVWVSGGYDHTVRLWDTRVQENSGCVQVLDHGHPIESLVALSTGNLLFSAGGNEVKAWDVRGGKTLHTLANHQKTVLELCVDGAGTRLLSGGLDGHIKIHDLSTFKVTHGLKCKDGVCSIALSPDNMQMAVGLVNGSLSLRRRSTATDGRRKLRRSALQRQQELFFGAQATTTTAPRAGTARYFNRGGGVKAAEDDLVVEPEGAPKRKIPRHDKCLKRFKYGDALDAALATTDPAVITSVVDELRHRRGLKVALSGRGAPDLKQLLKIMTRYITKPQFSRSFVTLADALTVMYDMADPPGVAKQWRALHRRLQSELRLHDQLRAAKGAMDMLMSAAGAARDGLADDPHNRSTDLQFLDPAAKHVQGIVLAPKQREAPSHGSVTSATPVMDEDA